MSCPTYEGEKFVGVTKKEVGFLRDWVHESWKAKMNMAGTSYWTDEKGKEHRKVNKPKWHHFREFAFGEEVRAIPLGKVLRFNQGDAFFARNLKFDVPATKPGKGRDTILMQAMKPKGKAA